VKYVMLIWDNPENWDVISDEEYGEYLNLDRGLLESGELVVSAALADPRNTRTIRVRGGIAATTDGPYAEAKEHLAGLFLVDCDSPERAIEIAATIPAAATNRIEVRPVMDVAGLER
jgi:hypothetical protein